MTGSKSKSRTRPGARGRSSTLPFALGVGGALAILVGVPAWSRVMTPSDPAAAASDPAAAATPADPWARFNRRAYGFNAVLDKALIGPVARVYKRFTPAPLRKGLGNVISNLREPSTALNALAQGRPRLTARAVTRFVANSTVGVLGVFDVAGRAGLEGQQADFGQTLGRYGVSEGPYLYLPVVGPLTVRDGLGGVVNTLTDPVSLATGGPGTDFATGRLVARGLDARAGADDSLRTIEEGSTDPYATVRSAYLQHRAAVVREATGAAEVLPDFDAPADSPEIPETAAPLPDAEDPAPPATPTDGQP